FLEYLRPASTDPRYLGFTFAQWMSILAFGIALYVLAALIKRGKPAPLVEELGDVYGGYAAGVAAPKRPKAESGAGEKDDADPKAKKTAVAKGGGKKKR